MPTVVSGIYKYVVKGATKVVNFDFAKPIKHADGKWTRAPMSRLRIARIRKQAIENGNEWPFDVPVNNKPVVFKGQKHLLRQAKRHQNIVTKMKEMPAKIAEYYKNMRAKRVRNTDPLYIIQHGWGRMK